MATQKKDKNEILPAIIMGCMFLIVYGLVLLLTNPFVEEGGVQSAFENEDNPLNIVYIIVIMFVMTLVILLIAKFWKEKIIQFIILGAVGYTSFFAFFLPIFSIVLSFTYYEITLAISILCAISLVIALYKYPEWYVIDTSGIVVGVGAIVIFGISCLNFSMISCACSIL